MVQVALCFDVDTLDPLVTPEMVDAAIAKAEADLKAEQAVMGSKDPVDLVNTQAAGGANAAKVPLSYMVGTQVARSYRVVLG